MTSTSRAASSAPMLADPANRVSRSAVWHWMTRYAVLVVLPTAALLAAAVLLPLPRTFRVVVVSVLCVVLVAGVAASVGLPFWRYSVHRWETTNGFVFTRSGAIVRDWRIVPLHRVQTVEVSQGLLERAFHVARLEIRTASYAGSTSIAGMDAEQARLVAEDLTAALAPSSDDGA
jgi:membrane protein YdbS with pleckstrin-like domain